jgi:hypothetical protein
MLALLQKPGIQLALLATAVGGSALFFQLQKTSRTAPANTTTATNAAFGQGSADKVEVVRGQAPPPTTSVSQTLDKLVLPPPKPPPPTLFAEEPKKQEKPKPLSFPPLVQLSQTPAQQPFVPQPPKIFAPRGTLIKVALIITLESNDVGTPVLGTVTEDVYWQGNLIVPAGTEVQAQAAGGSRKRDRIDVRGAFTFIWDDGSEYVCSGIALDHQPLPDGSFAITDGSPGIRGEILKTDEYAELKLLLSQALEGVANNQQDRFQSIYGLVPQNTNRNAALGGVASGANGFADILSKRIEKDFEYVRCAAGTSFYIFTTDVFEPELRSIAGLRQGNAPITSTDLQRASYERLVSSQIASEKAAADGALAEQTAAANAARSAQFEQARRLLTQPPADAPPAPAP